MIITLNLEMLYRVNIIMPLVWMKLYRKYALTNDTYLLS